MNVIQPGRVGPDPEHNKRLLAGSDAKANSWSLVISARRSSWESAGLGAVVDSDPDLCEDAIVVLVDRSRGEGGAVLVDDRLPLALLYEEASDFPPE